uniref:Mce/MlaD domain-containing protein n=1 Tax=Yamadaella caenomyce TaxID=259029 RepID=A0A1G4NYN7_9FLOR|nr:Hypothetical protein ycf22 [Yamadaella caenomyce]SCW23755.1 Hypothetical protein ycf22 [Yamadaella caenomyce]
MTKSVSSTTIFRLRKVMFLFFMLFFAMTSWLVINRPDMKNSYSVFVEFDNAYGIKPGTPVRLRGLDIGSVVNIDMNLHSVLVLIRINSSSSVIPKRSLVETTQTGLLNDCVIDIIPQEYIKSRIIGMTNPLSHLCRDDKIVCHLSYLEGDRGLNYDDLVRATTRISQRFDDPRFFNLFYVFLTNSIRITDNMINTMAEIADSVLFLTK